MDSAKERAFSFFIEKINRLLVDGSGIEEILNFVFTGLSDLIPFERMGVGLLTDDQHIKLYWVKAHIHIEHLSTGYTATLANSTLGDLIEARKPRIIADLVEWLKEHPESQSTRLALKDGIRSSLTYPLVVDGRAIGAVFFSSRLPNQFSLEHAEMFSAVAGEVAVIMQQSRLKNYFDQNQTRDKTVSHIIHDLRSPIGVIQAYLDFAQGEPWYDTLGPEAKKVYEVLARNSEHAMALLKDLTEVRHLTSGRLHMVYAEVQLAQFIKEMSTFGRMLASRKEIMFMDIVEGTLPPLATFDEMNLRRVLDNLFSNAVKFSDRGKTVTFKTIVETEKIRFSVSDEGPGIPLAEQKLLFTEFGKTSVRPTEGESSTGLGLAIAKEILRLHGGDIMVQSSPGSGSTFEFWIPLKTEN